MRPVALALTLLATSALAADNWTTPFAGVRKLYRTSSSPNWQIHALEIRLDQPGISLRSSASGERRRTPSSFARLVGAQLAVNADFFSYTDYSTSGLAAGNGVAWSDTADNSSNATFAFGAPASGNRVELSAKSATVTFNSSWMKGVVSGHPDLIRNGTITAAQHATSFCTTRHPRTALGLSQDSKTLYLVVVDGRSTASVGMTCTELSNLLKGLGAYQAVNLDGGGSSAMYVAGQGIVNRPSDGTERTVGNALAVFAPSSGTLGTLRGLVYEGTTTAARLSGVTVQVTGGPRVTTGTDGVYEFDLPPGNWTVTATKAGFQSQTVTRTVASGQIIWGSMGLTRVASTTDTDLDGVVDTADNCPTDANANQRDTDADAEGDVCDGDDDGDLVPDEDDNCPLIRNENQADADRDRIGDACDPVVDPIADAGLPDAGIEEPEVDAGVLEPEPDAGTPPVEVVDAGTDAGTPVAQAQPPMNASTDEREAIPRGCSSVPLLSLLPMLLVLARRRR